MRWISLSVLHKVVKTALNPYVATTIAGTALLGHNTNGQAIQAEVMTGHRGTYYQHVVSSTTSSERSNIGFLGISSLFMPYGKQLPLEMMSQVYVTYPMSKAFGVGAGVLYVNNAGVRPSLQLQFYHKKGNVSFALFPRVDIWKNPAYEVVSIIEYQQDTTNPWAHYARLQLQTIWNDVHHVKSYQYFRLGVHKNSYAFGLSVSFDQYGREAAFLQNYGVFILKHF